MTYEDFVLGRALRRRREVNEIDLSAVQQTNADAGDGSFVRRGKPKTRSSYRLVPRQGGLRVALGSQSLGYQHALGWL
jgi:hypothetical protein